MTAKQWTAPGPGQWEFDDSHQHLPMSRQAGDLMVAHFSDGFVVAGKRYGLLVQGANAANVDGWFFVRIVPVGGEKPGPMPPKPVFKLLMALHPELRRRRKAAEKALASVLWHRDAEAWEREGAPKMRARMRGLQAAGLGAMDNEALSRHIDRARETCVDGFAIHFQQAVAHYIGIGDWLTKVQAYTGENPQQALRALKGHSPSSIDTMRYLDAIAEAIRATPGAAALLKGDVDAEERLKRLRQSSPAVAQAIDSYLEEHGNRVFTDFDLTARTLGELPESVLATIAAHLERRNTPAEDDGYAEGLRARVPPEHRAEYDALLASARAVYGMRDSDVGPTFQWPLGVLRLALLEAGRRLADEGRIEERDHVFEASDQEIRDLLAGRTTVTATELRERMAVRGRNAAERPPRRLGEDEGPPPPADWLPPALGRINEALFLGLAIDVESAEAEAAQAAPSAAVKGLSANHGVATGRACVLTAPDDFSKLRAGDILVAPFTTPAYNVVLPLLAGVVTDRGGILSHAAIVAREYGIPAVVGTRNATTAIPDGAIIRVDGAAGSVEVVEAPVATSA